MCLSIFILFPLTFLCYYIWGIILFCTCTQRTPWGAVALALGLLCFNSEQTYSVLACVSRETSFHRELCCLGGDGREEDPEIARFDCTAALLNTQKQNPFS